MESFFLENIENEKPLKKFSCNKHFPKRQPLWHGTSSGLFKIRFPASCVPDKKWDTLN